LTTQSKVADKVRLSSGFCKSYFVENFAKTVQIPGILRVVLKAGNMTLKKGGGDPKK